MLNLFKRNLTPAVSREAAGVVRLSLIMPDNTQVFRSFFYNTSVEILHPDDKSSWFLIILDKDEKDAFTFGIHQDHLFSMEIIEGHYDVEKGNQHGQFTVPD